MCCKRSQSRYEYGAFPSVFKTDEQFSFHKGHSTMHTLHISVQSTSRSLHDNRQVLGIFIDLDETFDTLDL